MKTALLPATRVHPGLRKRVESLLRDEETVSAFVEAAVTRYVEFRAAQQELLARGHDAEAADDWVSPEKVFKAVRKRAAAAKQPATR